MTKDTADSPQAENGPARARRDEEQGIIQAKMLPVTHAVGLRGDFARTHLRSAAILARRAKVIEDELAVPPEMTRVSVYAVRFDRDVQGDERYPEHTACVVGTIFAAVAASEAAVAEVYTDAYMVWEDALTLRHQGGATSMTLQQERLGALWSSERFRRAPMREKTTEALGISGATLGALETWPNMLPLTQLRNLLIHYSEGVTWISSDIPRRPATPPHYLQDELETRGITATILFHDRGFPYTHLSYACALWAVGTTRQFVEQFWSAMGRPPQVSQD